MVSWKKMFISLIYKVRDDENGCSSPSEADEQSSSTRLLEFWPRPVINTQCSPSTLLDYWRGGTTTSTTSPIRSFSPGWHQLQILQVKDAEWFLTWRNVFLTDYTATSQYKLPNPFTEFPRIQQMTFMCSRVVSLTTKNAIVK